MAKKVSQLEKPFRNRIIGSGMERVDQMLANPLNFRLHPDNQQQALAGAIDDIGFIRSVTVNQRTGRVIDGHLRVTLAMRSNVEELPVEYVDLDEAEEAQALLSLDPIAAMAAADKQKLDELMRQVQSDDERVQAFMAEIAEREGLEYGKVDPPDDPGAQVDRAEELREKWGVESGQLWQLGEHRLICGDCTDKAVVERVMGGEKAEFCFTDPPYGVKYTGGTKKWTMLENDDEVNMYAASIPIIRAFTTDKAALYCAFASANARSVYNSFFDGGYEQRALIIWNKNHAQFGAMGSQYKQKHEPIAYCHKEGYAPHWFGPNNEVTVWDVDREVRNEFHPTQKPPELYERAMRNSAPDGCVVFEPFSGSGTAIIACERLGRKCRAIEISPAYCAVAIQRWVDMTGQTPVLVTD